MSIKKFLTSKAFFLNLAAAVLIIVVISIALLQWMKITTNHGQKIEVPQLKKLKVEEAISRLEAENLSLVILDTLDFDKDFPPLAVIEQEPAAGTGVKEHRKIYVKVNASGYSKVTLPSLEQLTFRQAVATIEAMGLSVGTTTYQTYIGRDVVLQVRQNGNALRGGEKVLKASKIDFVLGDGKAGLSVEELDEAPAIESSKQE